MHRKRSFVALIFSLRPGQHVTSGQQLGLLRQEACNMLEALRHMYMWPRHVIMQLRSGSPHRLAIQPQETGALSERICFTQR